MSSASSPWWHSPSPEWMAYWQSASEHRKIVTDMILSHATADSRVCIWGGGTCHDLDLVRMSDSVQSVHIVDINLQHVQWAIEFQGRPTLKNVTAIGPIDVAGIAAAVEQTEDSPRMVRLNRIFDAVGDHRLPESVGQYDVVASTGLISQLLTLVLESAPQAGFDQAICDVFDAVRRNHLRLMLEHIVAGGMGIVVTDFVTSTHVPEVVGGQPNWLAKVQAALHSGDHLQGLHPEQLQTDLMRMPAISSKVADVEFSPVWLWPMVHEHFACYGVTFTAR